MKSAILYVLDYYLPHQGGVETVFEQIITRTLQSGKKVIILTSQFDPSLSVYEKKDNLTLYRIGKGRLSFMFFALIKGWSILKKHQISFIHTSTYGGGIPAWILGFLFDKKVLITVHEIFDQLRFRYKGSIKGWLYLWFEKLLFALPYSLYHTVSYYTLNALRLSYGIGDRKLRMVHNGVDLDFWNPVLVDKEDKNQISEFFSLKGKWNLLYFGHTGISKGIDFLVEAIPGLLSKYSDLQLIFNFIPAKRQSEIEEKISTLLSTLASDQQNRVIINYGLERVQLRALVASVDGVIAPSLSEGFGSVHSEVCAMRKPLLTTKVAAIPEVVSGKVVLCEAGSVQAIIDGVERLRKGDFEEIGDKEFIWEIQYQKIKKLYQELDSTR